jgi:hypothetical protein
VVREKDIQSGPALIIPRPVKIPATEYYSSNFATYSRDRTWIYVTSYSSDEEHKPTDRVVTISLFATAMYRALSSEAGHWQLLLGGAKMPCKQPVSASGNVPMLASNIKVRLVCDVSFAHGLASDPAIIAGDFHTLTSLDTPGVRSFETSADIPLVHIEGNPISGLYPGGIATDFAAISLLLPFGLSFSSPLPEGRYVGASIRSMNMPRGLILPSMRL